MYLPSVMLLNLYSKGKKSKNKYLLHNHWTFSRVGRIHIIKRNKYVYRGDLFIIAFKHFHQLNQIRLKNKKLQTSQESRESPNLTKTFKYHNNVQKFLNLDG